jgi:hypothetical protein
MLSLLTIYKPERAFSKSASVRKDPIIMKETKLFVIPLLKKPGFHMNRKSPGGSPGDFLFM